MLPSERRFGALLSAVLVALAVYLARRHGAGAGQVMLGFGALGVAALAVWAPVRLKSLNLAWFKLGQLMGRLVNPFVLGLIWVLLMTPIAVIGRLLGRDELRLRRRAVDSHWIERDPPGPAADSYKNQF